IKCIALKRSAALIGRLLEWLSDVCRRSDFESMKPATRESTAYADLRSAHSASVSEPWYSRTARAWDRRQRLHLCRDEGYADHAHDQHHDDVDKSGGEASGQVLEIADDERADRRPAADANGVDKCNARRPRRGGEH